MVEEGADPLLVAILVGVVDAVGVEEGDAALEAVNLVAFVEQECAKLVSDFPQLLTGKGAVFFVADDQGSRSNICRSQSGKPARSLLKQTF